MTKWITSHPDHLSPTDTDNLAQVESRSPMLERLSTHVTAFAEMLTGRHGDRLNAWLASADNDDLPHLQSFVQGIRRDHAVVLAGLTLSHSSGPSKATSAVSRPSNARCSAAPTSTCSGNGSFWPESHLT
ncbi:hypothetical protein [Nonomuraea sp. NPDC049141]|uniref:hypothetical protein n=1 Tax=Nonomuraea sp. NPDC049141 TaxID=3155500 RepID=UPI0033EA38D8